MPTKLLIILDERIKHKYTTTPTKLYWPRVRACRSWNLPITWRFSCAAEDEWWTIVYLSHVPLACSHCNFGKWKIWKLHGFLIILIDFYVKDALKYSFNCNKTHFSPNKTHKKFYFFWQFYVLNKFPWNCIRND